MSKKPKTNAKAILKNTMFNCSFYTGHVYKYGENVLKATE